MEQTTVVPPNVRDDPGPTTEPAASAEELARAAVELAALVEHHRQELLDTMAELTRLQRVLRAETRAAIEAIREASGATAGDGTGTGGPAPS